MVPGYIAAGSAGRPSVFVVQPGQHAILAGLFHAGFDGVHKFFAQIRRSHSGAAVHVEAPHTHLLEDVDLPGQLMGIEAAVPCPEGGAAVFASWVGKQFGG